MKLGITSDAATGVRAAPAAGFRAQVAAVGTAACATHKPLMTRIPGRRDETYQFWPLTGNLHSLLCSLCYTSHRLLIYLTPFPWCYILGIILILINITPQKVSLLLGFQQPIAVPIFSLSSRGPLTPHRVGDNTAPIMWRTICGAAQSQRSTGGLLVVKRRGGWCIHSPTSTSFPTPCWVPEGMNNRRKKEERKKADWKE